jgi:hypothetical protein
MPSVARRIIKRALVDADDKPINPVSAFTRFGCWPLGSRSYLAVVRGILATAIGITIFVDWGLIDSLAHFKRQSNDGDSVWFWFRPQDWIHASTVVMLATMIFASGIKRVDSEMDTEYKTTYLIIWNLLIAILPLSASSLIVYYHSLRWGASADDAYESTIIQAFIISCLELLWGAWPSDVLDVALPMILAVLFLAYTIVLSKSFHLDLYTQLDWEKSPDSAAYNSFVFLVIVLLCSLAVHFIASVRNKAYSKLNHTSYLPVETNPLFNRS